MAAFPTYRVRSAIRDLGKALALPQAELERLARLTDGWSTDGAAELARLPDGVQAGSRAGAPSAS